MAKEEAKAALSDLMEALDERIYTNSGVREAAEQLYAIASNLQTFFELDNLEAQASPLPDVLYEIAASPVGRGMKRKLRRAADLAEDLQDYAEESHYEGLDDSGLDSADEVRAALCEILEDFLTKVGVLAEES